MTLTRSSRPLEHGHPVHAEGAACLMVTHSSAAAARADRVLRLTPRGIAPGTAA